MQKTLTAKVPITLGRRGLAAVQHIPAALAGAAHDAVRAAWIAPRWHSFVADRQRRSWRWYEIVAFKAMVGARTFSHSFALRRADAVLVPRLGTEGLLANLLHVIEVLHRVRADAQVHVSWVLDGTEFGFRYGAIGDNVWTRLFAPIGSPPREPFWLAGASLDHSLWGDGKDYLTGRALTRQRRAYHQTVASWVQVINERVRLEVDTAQASRFDGKLCIGVHRRVPNMTVANCMDDGLVPTVEDFVAGIRSRVRVANATEWVVFLATDDAEAVPAFRAALGDRLFVRQHVQRTTSEATEVHCQEWGALSLHDAEDVLIDTLLLARCHVLLHGSSSVSTAVALLNPDVTLVRIRAAGRA
jgi:hypothetical protein